MAPCSGRIIDDNYLHIAGHPRRIKQTCQTITVLSVLQLSSRESFGLYAKPKMVPVCPLKCWYSTGSRDAIVIVVFASFLKVKVNR